MACHADRAGYDAVWVGDSIVAKPRLERLVTSEPLNGTLIPVEVATHVAGLLEFESGAVVSIVMSFDVPRHNHAPIEIYGTEGSILVPDPNKFGGEVAVVTSPVGVESQGLLAGPLPPRS